MKIPDRIIDSTIMLLMMIFGFMTGIIVISEKPKVRHISAYAEGVFYKIVQVRGVDYA